MRTPLDVLAFLLGTAPKLASDPRLGLEASEADDGSSSHVWSPPGDCAGDRRNAANAERGLHVCPACGSKLVQPTCWEQTASRAHWRVWRRCPDCEWQSDGIHDEQEIDAFDEALDEGSKMLAKELDELVREGVREAADVLSVALAADLITADDFRL